MNVLIVYAHPEPASFTAQLKDQAVETLTHNGHDVQVSDLYAMQFKPVIDWDDFSAPVAPEALYVRAEQLNASLNRTFSRDILLEQEKVRWSQLMLWHFPMWWYSLPAILKGWVDRVLSYGFAYGIGRDLSGRRAMLVTTTGGPTRPFTPQLRETVTELLDHVQRRVLHLCGFDVLPPFAAYGANNATLEQRNQFLTQYSQILEVIDRITPIKYR